MFELNNFMTAGKFFLIIATELVVIFVAVAFFYRPASAGLVAGRAFLGDGQLTGVLLECQFKDV